MATTGERIQRALARMDPDDLARLLVDVPGLAEAAEGRGPLQRGWPWAPPRTGAPDLAELARLLASPQGFDVNLAGLDLFTLCLARLAVWHGGRLRREQALAHTGGAHGAALDKAARRLQRRLLAASGDGWLTLLPGVADMLGLPGPAAADHHRHATSDELAGMLRALGHATPPPRKAERLDALLSCLRDPDAMAATVRDMPSDVLRVFKILCGHGPQRLADLGIPHLSPWQYPPRKPTTIDWLLDRGLAGVDYETQRCAVWLEVIVALSGGRLYDTWQAEPPAAHERPLADGPPRVPPVVERLDALLELWAAQPPDALASGGLGVRPVRAAAKRLGLSTGAVGLLAHLAIRAGLLGRETTGTKGRGRSRTEVRRWAPTVLADRWREEPAAQRWARLVQVWRDDHELDEVEGLPERSETTQPQAAPWLAREAFLRLLADLPAGTGVPVDELAALGAWHRPFLLVEAATRGLVDAARVLGLVPAEGPVGLTAAGRALLDGPAALEAALPAGRRELVVQADLTVITPPDADPDVCAELARFADCESDAGARVWRLSEQRLTRALDSGADAEDIEAFLRAHATFDLPDNVAYLLADAARRHGRVRAGKAACYLRSVDPALLAGAVAVRAAKLRLLAPTVAVSPLPRAKLLAVLRDRGVSLVAEDTEGATVADTPRPAAEPVKQAGGVGLPEPRGAADARALAEALLAGGRGAQVPLWQGA